MNRIVSALAAACCALLFAAAPATALTFKKGEVLGPDGTMYQGASPEERERLIKKAAEDGETAGVSGSSLFVVMDGEIMFIPLSDLQGKSRDTRMDIVKAHVVANVADIDVEDLLEDAGNLEEALASRMEGIEAGIEAGLSATESVALDNALATATTAAEQAAAKSALEAALDAVEGVDEEVAALFDDPNSVFDGEGNYLGKRDEMSASGEMSDC